MKEHTKMKSVWLGKLITKNPEMNQLVFDLLHDEEVCKAIREKKFLHNIKPFEWDTLEKNIEMFESFIKNLLFIGISLKDVENIKKYTDNKESIRKLKKLQRFYIREFRKRLFRNIKMKKSLLQNKDDLKVANKDLGRMLSVSENIKECEMILNHEKVKGVAFNIVHLDCVFSKCKTFQECEDFLKNYPKLHNIKFTLGILNKVRKCGKLSSIEYYPILFKKCKTLYNEIKNDKIEKYNQRNFWYLKHFINAASNSKPNTKQAFEKNEKKPPSKNWISILE